MKVRIFNGYVIIDGDGYEMSILIPPGYTPQQALDRHASECRVKAAMLNVQAERADKALTEIDRQQMGRKRKS